MNELNKFNDLVSEINSVNESSEPVEILGLFLRLSSVKSQLQDKLIERALTKGTN